MNSFKSLSLVAFLCFSHAVSGMEDLFTERDAHQTETLSVDLYQLTEPSEPVLDMIHRLFALHRTPISPDIKFLIDHSPEMTPAADWPDNEDEITTKCQNGTMFRHVVLMDTTTSWILLSPFINKGLEQSTITSVTNPMVTLSSSPFLIFALLTAERCVRLDKFNNFNMHLAAANAIDKMQNQALKALQEHLSRLAKNNEFYKDILALVHAELQKTK